MKHKGHSPEEIIKKLREAAALIAGGNTAKDAADRSALLPLEKRVQWR